MATWQPPQTAPRPLRLGDLRAVRIAAVIAALLLVGGVILRGSLGLTREAPERIVHVDPVTGLLAEGQGGLATDATSPLFDAVALSPGETVSACVRVDYRGEADPDAVALQLAGTDGSAALASRLLVLIERGELADGEGCAAFASEVTVAHGPMADLARISNQPRGAWRSWDPTDGEASTWYRIAVTLDASAEDRLQGARTGTGFLWSAVGPTPPPSWVDGLLLVLGSIARDTVLPVLILLAITVLFLGIQDRIDRRDPKLALAPLNDDPLAFSDPHPIVASAPVRDREPELATTGGAPWTA